MRKLGNNSGVARRILRILHVEPETAWKGIHQGTEATQVTVDTGEVKEVKAAPNTSLDRGGTSR